MDSEFDRVFRSHDERTPSGRVAAWVHTDYASDCRSVGLFEPGRARALVDTGTGPRGRAATAVIDLPHAAEALHLRAARHGGWLAPLLRDVWPGLERQRREIEVTAELLRAGAPVPTPLLVLGEYAGYGLWRAWVGTRHFPDAPDAAVWLASLDSDADPERIVRVSAAAGAAVRCFHDAGGSHRDLHLGNLLICEGAAGAPPTAQVVDLDRATRGAAPDPRRRTAELMRLLRSALKRGLLERAAPGLAAFASAYTRDDPALRDALSRHLPRERLRLHLHRLGYAISGRPVAGGFNEAALRANREARADAPPRNR